MKEIEDYAIHAVSYTHLDVYKRQGLNSSADSSGNNALVNENSIKQKYASLTDDQVANMREQLELSLIHI